MQYLLYRNGEPWGAMQRIDRRLARTFLREAKHVMQMTCMRNRGSFALFFEHHGRSYNLVIDARG